ncbi:MAG: class I adenylate-forming enzyme family protein [Burkholderiaceae bacterium]
MTSFQGSDPRQPAIPWSAALQTLASRFTDRPAFSDGKHTLSYQDLCARAHGLALALRRKACRQGVHVASLLPNCLDAAWVSYGMKISGVAEAPMNYGYTSHEIAWSSRIAKFGLVVTDKARAAQVQELGLDVLVVDDVPPCDPGLPLDPVPASMPGRILFTSGTTGLPKAAVYSHGRRWSGEQLLKATMPFVPAPGERILLMTPFTHGASLLAFAWCDYGGEVLLLNGVQTDIVSSCLESAGVSAVFAPPTMLAKLSRVLGQRRFDGVRCVFTGTQPLTASLYDTAAAMFGHVVRVTFGKTECINPITVLDGRESEQLYASSDHGPGTCVGWPSPGIEIRIALEPGGENTDAPGEGEVWLRGQQMSDCMLDENGFRPHEPDGWHRTGDQGYLDGQGRLWLTGRLADVIKTGGYRVNPDEVQWVIGDGNADIVIAAIPSDYWGEVIVAVAENPKPGWEAAAQERAHKLSRHKQPRAYVAVAEFPRNAQGKVSRRKLAQAVLEQYTFIDGPYPSLTPLAH